jgi:multicomponent Na+:H+ antiporter subunit D
LIELVPLLIAGPLAAAALITALHRFVRPLIIDGLALATTLAVAAGAAALVRATRDGPVVVWLGGWQPREGMAIGITLTPDVLGSGFALLIAVLIAAVLLFGRVYFGEIHGLFQALLLIFLGAAAGYCITGDFFNLYVFFELVGVTAFVLTAFRMEEDALHGAMTFAIVNSIASFLLLSGIGVLYALAGTVNLAELGRTLEAIGDSAAVRLAFVLIMAGFLIKAAAVPFHFWLTDAYAGAAAPVCVLFGGASVTLGVFGAARVLWTVFGTGVLPPGLIIGLFWPIGLITALYASLMALVEPNIKRVLALTTVSHVGVLLVALGLQTAQGIAGGASYLLGHALIKAALFVCAGIIIARFGTSNSLLVRGRGRGMVVTTVLFILGGLMLAGLPLSAIHDGKSMILEGVRAAGGGGVAAALTTASVLSGAAVLVVAGRVFWGRVAEGTGNGAAPSKGPLAAMAGIAAMLLIAGALATLPELTAGIASGARNFVRTADYAHTVLDGAPFAAMPVARGEWRLNLEAFLAPAMAVVVAAVVMGQQKLPGPLRRATGFVLAAAARLHRLHTGHIGDYIAWMIAGVCVMGVATAILAVAAPPADTLKGGLLGRSTLSVPPRASGHQPMAMTPVPVSGRDLR